LARDALALALLQARGFTEEDFARSHPAGALGRRLLLKISDIMHHGDELPKVLKTAYLSEALIEMTQKKLGMTAVVDENNHAISLTVPDGTDVTKLIPMITISNKASISPNNNIAQDFTSPVTYTVTAEDGSKQNYIVTVSVIQ